MPLILYLYIAIRIKKRTSILINLMYLYQGGTPPFKGNGYLNNSKVSPYLINANIHYKQIELLTPVNVIQADLAII